MCHCPLGANVLRGIDHDVVRVRDLPPRAGVSKEAIAMALHHLQRTGMIAAPANRSVVLTADGRDALAGYRARVAGPENPALRVALEAILSQRDALSAGLRPPEGCWRGEKPYLDRTRRLLADPTGALPWHPMVLHRGAWPDGS